jgi:hypothetical protein
LRAQKEITDRLASGESKFQGELGHHVRSCASCTAFLTDQATLFRAIDSGLHIIADEPVPPSLLPGIRVRLEEEVSPRLLWIPTWRVGATAALVVLAVAIGIELRRSATTGRAIGNTSLVAHAPGSESLTKAAAPRALAPFPQPTHPRITTITSVPAPSQTPEVLVLREEQQGFAHFVNELSNDRDAALALASAKPGKDNAPVEIALLSIDRLEVELLEGSSSE